MVKRDTWNPSQYEKFEKERNLPFYDLVNLVRRQENLRVLDVGCGSGKLTQYLHQNLAARETIGVDASENMLTSARQLEGGGLRFEFGHIEDDSTSEKFDLVVSNSALQWVKGHEALFEKLRSKLQPNGQLAVQIPAMNLEPAHISVVETAQEFSEELEGYVCYFEVWKPEDYAKLLYKLGFVEQRVKLEIYPHILPSREAVVEWYRGTILTTYEQRLDAETYERFVSKYREKVMSCLSDERPFFFPYKRILLWGLIGDSRD
jgi:trans-aconitate 2-methyltransferase